MTTSARISTASWRSLVASRVAIAFGAARRRPRVNVRGPAGLTLALLGATFVVLFGLLMAFADARAIIWARGLPLGVVETFRWITDLGKAAWFLYPLPALMIVLLLLPRDLPRAAQATFAALFARIAFLFFAIGIPYWFNAALKQVIGRARPFVGGASDPYLFRPFSWGPEYASLASNHTVTVCAVAIAFGAPWPRLRPALWLYALVIAASRVIVIAHHPSDVLAGAAVGIFGALLVRNYFAARSLVFGVTRNGKVEAFAGPSWKRIKAALRSVFA
jgi:membrane-associated phospholipid phosphatase